ncbi:MAG: CheR family methyltransferase [Burkholderiaceae bacterium]
MRSSRSRAPIWCSPSSAWGPNSRRGCSACWSSRTTRDYAGASLKRRLGAALAHFGSASLSQLQHALLHEPAVFGKLLDFFTVQVSDMFRDPAYFAALREQVLPLLRTYPSPRIWVAGCSTGEEAYSFAVLLREEGLLAKSRIYATDINPNALQTARDGTYDIDRMAGFTENHRLAGGRGSLSEHYTAAYGRAIFDQALKQRIVFSDHSLTTDAVFAEVQFVSCRNVLIYFNRALQDRAIGLFHEALCRKGFLGIGSRESLRFSSHAASFDKIDRDNRILRRKETP